MIQRIQTLYLLLAATAGGALGYFNLWKADLEKGIEKSVGYFNATSNFLIFTLIAIITLLALVTIFLFKNRKQQFKLTVVNVLLSIGLIVGIYMAVQSEANKYVVDGFTITRATFLIPAIIPVILTVLLFLAARGIYKDEKLIKSLDRLR
jgi:uncharacterized membrane protein YqjE